MTEWLLLSLCLWERMRSLDLVPAELHSTCPLLTVMHLFTVLKCNSEYNSFSKFCESYKGTIQSLSCVKTRVSSQVVSSQSSAKGTIKTESCLGDPSQHTSTRLSLFYLGHSNNFHFYFQDPQILNQWVEFRIRNRQPYTTASEPYFICI